MFSPLSGDTASGHSGEEEEEEEKEDLFVFNATIEGPRAPAVMLGRITQACFLLCTLETRCQGLGNPAEEVSIRLNGTIRRAFHQNPEKVFAMYVVCYSVKCVWASRP
jgi:hypothetical protein